jgi:hypothetical protein
MSKAFTREDDTGREAELPDRVISPHPNLVTAEGLAQIEAAIARLAEEQGRAQGCRGHHHGGQYCPRSSLLEREAGYRSAH